MKKRKPKGFIFINLTPYLKKLQALERSKPEEARLHVPTLSEISQSVGSSTSTLYRLASGNFTNFNVELAAAIIEEMRSRGFNMEITDLIDYVGPPARRPEVELNDDEGEINIKYY